VRELVSQGFEEVILTATNLGDYGSDWAGRPELETLCRRILDETPLRRLRVSSLDPTEITEGLFALVESEPRFCPHFHVSLQSAHSRVLRAMKRKYDAQAVETCLSRIAQLRPPSGEPVHVGMDVITGFPGETDEFFQESLERLGRLPWSRLHVFPYSEREGTPATRLPGKVPTSRRSERARQLRELSLSRVQELFHARLRENRILEEVLLEAPVSLPGDTRKWISGYTPSYWRVLVPVPEGVDPRTLRNRRIQATPVSVTLDRAGGEAGFLASAPALL
jgi:threonylcarbamoyladenosine tRNA methylthiotransferase MtaB